MANSIFNKKDEKFYAGKVSTISKNKQEIYANHWKATNFLSRLKNTGDKYDAIDLIVKETPDGSMALSTYLNYTMQGGVFEFSNAKTGKITKKYDAEFRDFCIKVGKTNSSGLDGLNREMAISSYLHGGMAIEIVVKDDLSDIDEVFIVDPKTFKKYEYDETNNTWKIYQKRDDGKLVNLYDGNFFYIPFQPIDSTPVGTLKFEPAIMTSTTYWQFMADIGVVLRRIAIPRYVLTVDVEALMASATAKQKADIAERQKLIDATFDSAGRALKGMGQDSDIVTSTSNKVDVIGGGVNGTGIDVRAWIEVLEPEMCNSFQLPLVLLNRQEGGSYALGTAEMKSFTDTVDSQRMAIKRMNEEIANMWARVKGYNIKAKYTPTPLDWQKQEEKWKAKLLELEFARRCEEYGYQSKESAAHKVGGDETPNTSTEGFYEYLAEDFTLSAADAAKMTATEDTSTTEQTTVTEDSEDNKNEKENQ